MEKFATAFAVPVTEEQYRQIAPKLEALGYEIPASENYGSFLVNNCYGINGNIGRVAGSTQLSNTRIWLQEFNEDLILALAAMTTSKDTVIIGEYCYNWRKDFVKRTEAGAAACGKPTAQELIDHFTKPKLPTLQEVIQAISENREPSPEQIKRLLKEKGLYIMRSTDRPAEYLEKLKQGWTMELVPPKEVKLHPDIVLRKGGAIFINGAKFGIVGLASIIERLSKVSYPEPGISGLMINTKFYSTQELNKIADSFYEIYGTPGVAPESASESIH